MQIAGGSDRETTEGMFAALLAATPLRFRREVSLMKLMRRSGDVQEFQHSQKRRGFTFDVVAGTFLERLDAYGVTAPDKNPGVLTATQAYRWTCRL